MRKFSLKSIKKDELFIHTFVEKEFPSEEESGIFSVLQVTLTFEASATSRDSLSMFLLVLAFRLNKLESLSFSATEFLLISWVIHSNNVANEIKPAGAPNFKSVIFFHTFIY